MSLASILIVDDEEDVLIKIKGILEKNYFKKIRCAISEKEMNLCLENENIDVVLLDNYIGQDRQGCDLIEGIKKNNKNIEVIVVTSDNSSDLIIKSIKNGAFYYLEKKNIDNLQLLSLIDNAYLKKKGKEESARLSIAYDYLEKQLEYNVLDESKHYEDIKNKLIRLSKTYTGANVLFVGENGVGKNELAKFYCSLLISSEMIPVYRIKCEEYNYQKLQQLFVGSEIKPGIFEASSKCIVILEDIKNLAFDSQNLILSILRDSFFFSKGGLKRKNRITVVATSDVDLKKSLKEGKISEDLYYELLKTCITVKPLRERKDDILHLVSYFSRIFSRNLNKDFPALPETILNSLISYDWPGNIVELKAALEKLFLFGYDEEDGYYINELPESILYSSEKIVEIQSSGLTADEIIASNYKYQEKLEIFKRMILEDTLKKTNYVVKDALKMLGLKKSKIYRDINCLNIQRIEN